MVGWVQEFSFWIEKKKKKTSAITDDPSVLWAFVWKTGRWVRRCWTALWSAKKLRECPLSEAVLNSFMKCEETDEVFEKMIFALLNFCHALQKLSLQKLQTSSFLPLLEARSWLNINDVTHKSSPFFQLSPTAWSPILTEHRWSDQLGPDRLLQFVNGGQG